MTLTWCIHETTRALRWPRLVQIVHAHKSEDRQIEGLHWWTRCCNSDREASILLAPNNSFKMKRMCFAYLGGGALSVASTACMQNIVVKAKTWQMGAAVIAACALLSRVAEDKHKPGHPELFLAAESVADKDDMPLDMMADEEASGPRVSQRSMSDVGCQFERKCEACDGTRSWVDRPSGRRRACGGCVHLAAMRTRVGTTAAAAAAA